MPRQIGEWTQDKLKVLSDYLPIYLKATTRAFERIYVDAFAGPGTNKLKGGLIDGSPLIALKAVADNGVRFDRLFFIEQDKSAATELEQAVASQRLARRATVIVGDVNVELPALIRTLRKRSPTFVFLDPIGIDPRWTTIEEIAPWQVELLINFPFGMSINRNPHSPKVTAYFGTSEWERIWRRGGTGTVRALLDLYKGNLSGLGFEYSTPIEKMIQTQRNQRLYYLLLASKFKPAPDIMRWVFRQASSSGQLPMDLS
jgi:three-Cys-motif partner protein